MNNRLAIVTALIAIGAIAAFGCGGPPPLASKADGSSPSNSSRTITAFTLFGSAHVDANPNQCAGRVELHQGAATVNDVCFTGDTDVVVCTDASAPNPVMCTPHRGSLTVAGTGTDTVSFARVE